MQTFLTNSPQQPSGLRFKFARSLALLVSASAGVSAAPWSASVGSAPRIALLRAPAADARAAAAWWLYEHATSATAAQDDPREELHLALTHERDPAAALAELAAYARLTRGTLEGTLRLSAVVGNGLVPEEARRAAVRALAAEVTAEQLPMVLSPAATAGLVDTSLTRLAARALAARPTALLSFALQSTAGNPSRRAVLIRALGAHGDPRWSQVILEALDAPRGPDYEPLTAAAIDAVAALGLVEAAPRLALLSADERAHGLRARAARALGSLGGSFDPAALSRAMLAPITRVAALEAAAALRDRRLAPACAPYLDAPISRDRAAAARCLGAMGDAGSTALLRVRRARETDARVLDALDESLGVRAPGDPRDTPALVRALSAATALRARVIAAQSLGERARGGDDLALDALSSLVRRERDLPSAASWAALRAAALAGAAIDDETLSAWLASRSAVTRQVAAHAAGVLGARSARTALQAMALREVDDDARRAAVIAVARAEGAAARGVIDRVDDTAFSVAQLDAVATARRVAASEGGLRAAYTAPISLARRGLEPGSVWGSTLPDGGLAVVVVGDDGLLRMEGGGDPPRRLDAP